MERKQLKYFTYFIVLTLLASSCSKKQSNNKTISKPQKAQNAFQMPPVEVEILTVETGDFTKTLEAVGELQSPQTTIITSDLMGKVTYLNVPEGKAVSAGHIFAKIEDSNEQASVKVARAKLKRAQDYYARMKSLNEEGAISNQDLDDATEQLEIAKAEYEDSNSTLYKNIITAPFSGYVGLKKISLGSYVSPGDEIVRISKTYPLDLVFTVPEKHVSEIKSGQKTLFMVDGSEKEYSAYIKAIDPNINPEDRTITIKAQVSGSSSELLPGRFTTVTHQLSTLKNIIHIPQEALVLEGNSTKVFVLGEMNSFESRNVLVGEWNDNSVEIVEGLKEGETIITNGHQKLRPGVELITKPYIPFGNKEVHKVSFYDIKNNLEV